MFSRATSLVILSLAATLCGCAGQPSRPQEVLALRRTEGPAPKPVRPLHGRPATPEFGFRDAVLGEPFTAWRQSSPQAASSLCERASVTVMRCLTPNQPLGGPYAARALTLTFTADALTSIDFLTSADGFDWVTGQFRQHFGDPDEIVRDQTRLVDGIIFPHVKMIWSNGRERIDIDDPTRCGRWLRVRLSTDAAPANAELRTGLAPCDPPL